MFESVIAEELSLTGVMFAADALIDPRPTEATMNTAKTNALIFFIYFVLHKLNF
jgi:hypothetical protein